jgi:hypothetical protein
MELIIDEFLIDKDIDGSRLSTTYNRFLEVPARKVSASEYINITMSYFSD